MRIKERPESPWYAIADMPPPYTVQVEIMIRGRHFIGARGRHPKRPDMILWMEWASGKPLFIPDDVVDALNDGQGAWRPQKPELWQSPLPEPIRVSQSGIMKTERSRFAAVEEAEAADLASEMERDRQQARDGARADGCPARAFEPQWWRDHSLIRYQPKESLTLRMVEGRLMRAVACSEIQLSRSGKGSRLLQEIGEAACRLLAESEAKFGPDHIPRLEPLPADNDDWLTAMSWFVSLYPVEHRPKDWAHHCPFGMDRLNTAQKILVWRAGTVPWSFAEIGKEFDWKGHQRAKQVFDTAIGDCWRCASGLSARRGLTTGNHIAILQARNRAAKNEAVA